MDKHIIAIGGGGFGRSIGDLKIEKYIISIANINRPRICFIPTASGDDNSYIINFYRAFTELDCRPSHIDFFRRTIDLEEHINNQDIIYVGGGNTKSMLAIWKDWGLDLILKKAYNSGKVMSGVSAGAICWFTRGITDSWKNDLAIIDCLDFVKGNCCPHYDEEKNRIPYVKNVIDQGVIDSCIAIEGNSALHIKNNDVFLNINFGDDKNTYLLTLDNKKLLNKTYKSYKI